MKAKILLFFCVFLLIVSVHAEESIIKNPSLEQDGPANWYKSGDSSYWASDGHTGLRSIALNGASSWWTSAKVPVSANHNLTFSFWVKATVYSGSFCVGLRFFDNASTFLSGINYVVSSNYSTWTLVNDTVQTPASCVQIDVLFNNWGSINGDVLTDDFYVFDNVQAPSVAQMWFNELLFGSGAWLGLTMILTLIFIVTVINKYAGLIFMPLTIFLAIDYLTMIPTNSNFMWGAILMLVTSVVIGVQAGTRK
jgi:hypothetical protein